MSGTSEGATFERLLKRDRTITLVGLAALCALAWLYIARGAGLGMSAWQMTTFALFPHQHPADTMPGMDTFATPTGWGVTAWSLITAMWWIMMVAMMTPSAAPTILLYARVYRHALAQGQSQNRIAPTGVFATGYLLAWLAFSVAAAGLHWALQHAGLISAMMMSSQSRWLSGTVLIAVGLYQLSPIKDICLTHCRAPASFLSRHWRPNSTGALCLGAMHGAYCVGCCWMLMVLLFVGGVMNLVWIAALALLVLVEKAISGGRWIGRSTGIALIAWGIATPLV
jgi:predicted metal-binding membrane protein